MEYQLQLKPFERKDGVKYKIIQITDIALHTTPHRPTSVGKKIKQAFAQNKPGRVYAPLAGAMQTDESSHRAKISIEQLVRQDPELMRWIQEEERKGYKILLGLPKGGIPVFEGADTREFLQSKNGKRVLRGLAKKK
jgi:hypothetical protein